MTILRPARADDAGQLVALLRLLFTIEADFHFDADRQRQGLMLLLVDERARVIVAENDGQVIGMCTGQLLISTAEGGPAVLVEDVVVAPQHRGRGTGRALMTALAEWAEKRGATRLQLLADRNNPPALAFYDRLGWRTTALICLRRHSAPSVQ